jgi:phage-related protein
VPGILYYVLAEGLTDDAFEIGATAGGVAIETSGNQHGIITGTATSSVLNNFLPPVDPSPGTKTKPELKLKEAAFGDGYTQTTRDGLNHMRRVVTLQWDVLRLDQAIAIEAFFENQGGDTPFYYALSGDTVRKWSCKDWDRSRKAPNTCAATLREDFSKLA